MRYASFLLRLHGPALPKGFAAGRHAAASGQLGFTVYAHSSSDGRKAQQFLGAYRPGSIVTGRRRQTANINENVGPELDFYNVGTFREQRWVGSITYFFGAPTAASAAA